MSKHSPSRVNNLDTTIEKVVVEKPKPKYKTNKITLRIDAKYKIVGRYSGQVYLFNGAGATQNVDETDIDWLLSLRQGKGCCGGGGENAIFEIALD